MTSLHILDQRLLDQRLSTPNTIGGMSTRPRYNTPIMTRFFKTSDPEEFTLAADLAKVRPITHGEYWDADLQSYMYLQDYLKENPAWMAKLTAVATNNRTLPQSMDLDQLDREMRVMLDLAPEREGRFMEVMDQDDADGAASYWLGMLQISPARHPATYLMVRVGRRIGEHVVMCLKGYFRSPRPSQLSPAIVPMIDPPGTPTFPAGHAVQAYLISYLLAYSLPNIPQQTTPQDKVEEASGALFKLADRVSQNRIVAGLHFPIDIDAGKDVGTECFKLVRNVGTVWNEKDGLRAKVRGEFPQYA